MTTYYCDDYERITGKKPEDAESVSDTETAEEANKALWPDSEGVETK